MGGKKELIIFIILANAIIFIFIIGVIFFIYQYRKRKIFHDQELNKLVEKHNQELLLSQIKVQQETMYDVSKEIHDNLGQKLTLASLYLHKVSRNIKDIKSEQILEVSNLLEESLKEVRRLSVSLKKSENKNLKLIDLVKNDLKRVEGLYNVKCELNFSNPLPTLPPFYVINLYRIIQEFIQNSLKHGQPSEIRIDFKFENKFLYLDCIDDGLGFDMNLVSYGNGVKNINHRVSDLSGILVWESGTNLGTKLLIKIPYS